MRDDSEVVVVVLAILSCIIVMVRELFQRIKSLSYRWEPAKSAPLMRPRAREKPVRPRNFGEDVTRRVVLSLNGRIVISSN